MFIGSIICLLTLTITFSCKWQGKPCEMKRDFQTRLLDIGLCHTFNFESSETKTVSQAGLYK